MSVVRFGMQLLRWFGVNWGPRRIVSLQFFQVAKREHFAWLPFCKHLCACKAGAESLFLTDALGFFQAPWSQYRQVDFKVTGNGPE